MTDVMLEARHRLAADNAGLSAFLPSKLVMIDCEMTGLDPRQDDVIQVAALKLELAKAEGSNVPQYAVVGQEFNRFIHTDAQPTSEFARTHMTEVYRKANESQLDYPKVKELLVAWLGTWLGEVSPAGDCVPTDILFLYMKGIVDLSRYDVDKPIPGTFHYEYYDMNAIKLVARHKAGYKFDKDLELIDGAHDALVDCKNQTTELNAIIAELLS